MKLLRTISLVLIGLSLSSSSAWACDHPSEKSFFSWFHHDDHDNDKNSSKDKEKDKDSHHDCNGGNKGGGSTSSGGSTGSGGTTSPKS